MIITRLLYSFQWHLYEDTFAVVAMIKSNIQNQYGKENEGGGGHQSDSKIWDAVLYWIYIYSPLVSNCGYLRKK